MPAFLVLMFILVPLAEILVIVQVGGAIGGWWTAGLLVADSLLGAYLLRIEGHRAWREFRAALEEGRWPGDEVAQGALIIVGGTLLLTPGFLTDGVGFLFLLGPTRRMVARRVRARVGGAGAAAASAGGRARGDGDRTGGTRAGSRGRATGTAGSTPRGDEVVLDVEVVEIEREQRAIRPPEDDDTDGGAADAPQHGGDDPGGRRDGDDRG